MSEVEYKHVDFVVKIPVGQSGISEGLRVLEELRETLAARNNAYGDPTKTYERLAALVNVILADKLGAPLTPGDMILVMAAVKIGRLMQSPGHEDSLRDLAGYAAIGVDVAKKMAQP